MLPSLYVAACLPSHVQVRIIDEDLEPVDFETDADLIGISFMTYNAPRAYQIADRFRLEKGKPVIFGGYHPTFLPEEAIEHADAVCIGDAEPNVPQMFQDFENGRLDRFYDDKLDSLAGLPVPDRGLIRRQNYAPIDAIQATRGCHYRCSFCSVAAFHQNRFRIRPVDEVIAELKTLGRNVLYMDDNLIGDREYAKQLFTEMIPLRKRWFSQCGIGIAYDQELLRLANLSGCRGLFIGFESLSEQGLRGYKKQSNLGKDYLQAVQRLHAARIAVFAGFVLGGDEDTPEVFANTLDFLLQANVEALQATRLTPFPGTPLFEDLGRQGRIFDRDWSHYDFNHVVFNPLNMSCEALDRGVAWLMSQFYARKNMARRLWRGLRYLDPIVLTYGVLALNSGYLSKMAIDGTLKLGAEKTKSGI
jgi:radical SAM superfamily enzyme YgiQ (UPF0313 family)